MSDKPQMSKIKHLSPVWFVPLLALFIALWLAVRAWQSVGPVIEIEFKDAAGIAVGKTQVRYRDVKVGEVKEIRLSDDFNSVRVRVEMDRHVAGLINDQSNFWVVSPKISLSGVSGIETLLSGVYIEMDSRGIETAISKTVFVGLEEPPAVRSYDEGSSYLLLAETLGSLDIGSPVYHRQVPVGEVTGYRLLPEQDTVQVRFFVKAPHDQLIKPHSQFWNVSGFDANLGLDGFELEVDTLSALISGGIEFDTPPVTGQQTAQAQPDHRFFLFEDRDAVSEGAITLSYPFLLRFAGSVRGLKVGAPVEYLGIQVGRVEHIALDSDASKGRQINVVIGIQPERMNNGEMLTEQMVYQEISDLVSNGMRARLQSASLVGGSLFVDLVPEASKGGKVRQVGSYPELPTSDSGYNQIARQLVSIVDRINAVPIETISDDLQATLSSLRAIADDLQRTDMANQTARVMENLRHATEGLDSTFEQLEKTLQAVEQTIAPDSALNHTLMETLDDISDASKSVEQLTDELFRYPDAVLRGKEDDKQ